MPKIVDAFRTHSLPLILVGVFFVLGLIRLNDVSIYSPDSALYLIWGNSVAHGQGFVDNTKPEADRYLLNAPLYAALLSPAEWLAPMSLTAGKIWTLIWGCAALLLFYFLLRSYFDDWTAIAGLILLGLNPMVLVFSTEVLSEAPFLVFMLSVFLLVGKFLEGGKDSGNMGAFILLVVVAGLSVVLREVGWALVMAAAAGLIIGKNVRPALGLLAAGCVVFGYWYVRNNIWVGVPPGGRAGNFALIFQHFQTPQSSSIISEFMVRAQQNLHGYAAQFGGSLFYSLFSNAQLNLVVDPSRLFNLCARTFEASRYFLTLVASILMVIGLLSDLWSRKGGVMRAMFVVLLLALISIYPVYDIRFLLPLLPLMIFYLLSGIHWIVGGVFRKGWNKFALVVLAGLLMIPNASALADILRTNLKYRMNSEAFAESKESVPVVFTWPWTKMGNYITANTEESALIASPVKDIARAVGHRKVLELEPNITEPVFESVIRDYNVKYLLAAVRWGDLRTYEFLMQESKRYAFTYLHSEGTLHLYKVTSRIEQNVNLDDAFAAHADTVTVSGLTRSARALIRQEKFEPALAFLAKAHAMEPSMEEPVFQSVIASVLLGDSVRAHAAYSDLLALPQTLSQSLIAAKLISAMELASAGNVSSDRHALSTLDAARTFWDNGYQDHARKLLAPVLEGNEEFFAGLLWGFHFNLQMGDTAHAYLYLGRLQVIDAANPVVKAFSGVQRMLDTIRTANSPVERARLHVAIAVQYRLMELPDVALDEAQRALRENPKYAPAMMLFGEMLEQKSRLLTAAQWYFRAAETDGRYARAGQRAQLLDSLARNGFTLAHDSASAPSKY